ncbi:sugar phosphate nucleotidyltransferase [Gorillibacterium sp. sgz5001074]|uniref:sugar phosphate nucleotidyltransferase n=1 Tax=Gorillibacterium sp. sgz5001074 TaxID=3446695 RepID=UPI003F678688
MKVLILSGGSGKRLWPLSNEIRSKAFLQLLPSEVGGMESMLQRICRQLRSAGLLSSALIVAHHSQRELVNRQTGGRVPVLCEPLKRGTFHAALLAAAYLHSRQQADPREPVVILPVDLFAEQHFMDRLKQLPRILRQSGAELALIGVQPSHPSTQFGYIVPRTDRPDEQPYLPVARFQEKPDEETARSLLKQGALWNCGVFGLRLRLLLQELERSGLPADDGELAERYPDLPVASLDHRIAEKSRSAAVLPYQGAWSDMGSWEVLCGQLQTPVTGSGSVTGHSEHTHLVNELPVPIHVVDVPNVIVAASADGVLVATKASSHKVKELLPEEGATPLYEEKEWGSSLVLEPASPQRAATTRVVALPGAPLCRRHVTHDEIWVIQLGSGELRLGESLHLLKPGTVLRFPAGSHPEIRPETRLVWLEIRPACENTLENLEQSDSSR